MIVDIFTHIRAPETAYCDYSSTESTAWFYDEENQKYLDLIAQRAKISDLALLVSPIKNVIELQGIPPERRFISYGGVQTGFVDRNDEERIRDIVKSLNLVEFRINGAYYGICTTHTALQIYLLTKAGEFLHPLNPDFHSKKQIIESGGLSAGNVSYGIVYNPYEPLELRLKVLARQLEREHTVVFKAK